jgi:hypothetical protein
MFSVPMTRRSFFVDDPFFQSTWSDHDRMRSLLLQEPTDIWKRFDDELRNFRCMTDDILANSMLADMQSSMPTGMLPSGMLSSGMLPMGVTALEPAVSALEQPLVPSLGRSVFPRRWMMPGLTTSADLLGDLDLFRERDTEVIRVRDTDEKLEVTLDTSDYKPDELKVSVQEGMVVMEGRHEEKSEDGSRQTTRQFIRRYVILSWQWFFSYLSLMSV